MEFKKFQQCGVKSKNLDVRLARKKNIVVKITTVIYVILDYTYIELYIECTGLWLKLLCIYLKTYTSICISTTKMIAINIIYDCYQTIARNKKVSWEKKKKGIKFWQRVSHWIHSNIGNIYVSTIQLSIHPPAQQHFAHELVFVENSTNA